MMANGRAAAELLSVGQVLPVCEHIKHILHCQLCIKNNANEPIVWDNISISNFIKGNENKASIKFVDRLVKKSEFYFNCLNFNNLNDEHLRKSVKVNENPVKKHWN